MIYVVVAVEMTAFSDVAAVAGFVAEMLAEFPYFDASEIFLVAEAEGFACWLTYMVAALTEGCSGCCQCLCETDWV